MKHILTIISTALLLLSPVALSAQQAANAPRSITGVVSDDQGILPGATITWENKDRRTVGGVATDYTGTYTLMVPTGETDLRLAFSYVGYKTVYVAYTGQPRLDVKLEMDALVLEAAQVTAESFIDPDDAFGQPRETIGYPTEIIDITQFQEMAVVSVEDMLVGKIAGLDIIGDGDPGTLSTLRIRGTASLNANNEPLIVVDNVPQDISLDPDFDFSDATAENFGSLVNISPNDIQNIEVLKDASATALWGDQAANGVLLITTKQGGSHTPIFNIQEKVIYTMKPLKFDLLDGYQYKVLMQDAMWNWVKDGGYNADRLNKLNNQKDILYDEAYNYFREYNQNTDWLDLVTRTSVDNTTDFSMSGGGDKARYYFSLGYENSGSTTVGADFERITSRLNVDYRFSDKFRVSSHFKYAESTRNQAYQHGDDGIETPRAIAMKKMPNMSPWVIDTDGNLTDEYFTAPNGDVLQSGLPNPLALVEESTNRLYAREVGASFSTNYNLFTNFTVVAQVSFDMHTQRTQKYLPESSIRVNWSDGLYNKGVEGMNNNSKTYLNLQARYVLPINNKKHVVRLSLGEQVTAETNNSYVLTTAGNGAKEVSLPSSGGKVTSMGSSKGITRKIGVLGSATYSFREKYHITFNGRIDANSGNALGSKWGNFKPTANGKWNMKKEPWMQNVKWVNELAITSSVGRTERAQELSRLTGTYNPDGWYGSDTWSSIYPEQMQLYNLAPEIETSFNVSVMGDLFNKLNFNFNYYQSTAKDQLQFDQTIPSSTGFTTVRVYNSGKVQNRGFDGYISIRDAIRFGDKDSKNKVTISFNNINFARNRNRVLELPANQKMEPSRYTLGNGNVPRKVIEGTPIGSVYGFEFDGIYQTYEETFARDQYNQLITDFNGKPIVTKVGTTWAQRMGDVRYVDQNYDGNINEYDIVYLGNSYPSIIGGATIQVKWKTLTFRTSLAYRFGHVVYNQARLDSEQMSGASNQSTNALARWRYSGEITEIPRALWSTNYNSLVSDQYVEDASFVKIKDVTLSYRLPPDLLKKLGIKSANLFFNAYNILTFTKYTGVDPEVQLENNQGQYSIALDGSKTPPARRFALGINFEF